MMAEQLSFDLQHDVREEEAALCEDDSLDGSPTQGLSHVGNPSREPDQAQSLSTVADMIAAIEEREDLSLARRRNMACSLRWLGKFAKRPPVLLPANLVETRSTLSDVLPAGFEITPRRYANIRADIVSAFKLLNLTQPICAGQKAMARRRGP
jgi:hypothetical protein